MMTLDASQRPPCVASYGAAFARLDAGASGTVPAARLAALLASDLWDLSDVEVRARVAGVCVRASRWPCQAPAAAGLPVLQQHAPTSPPCLPAPALSCDPLLSRVALRRRSTCWSAALTSTTTRALT
jgi:hypothetical protein